MALKAATHAEYTSRIGRATALLERDLDQHLTPAELAHAASFSLQHFHRIFKAEVGESVMHYTRRLKLERAARKLTNSQARILDVALAAGYESHEAFTRAFSERFGATPSAYRDELRADHPQRAQLPSDAARNLRVELKTFDAMQVVYMRHRGSFDLVGETWAKLLPWADARGLLGHGPNLYGICPDDPEVTAIAQLRFDACVHIPSDFAADTAVTRGQIDAGIYAATTHRGPYSTLHNTYFEIIGCWFPKSGYALAPDAVVEQYLNDPRITPPEDLLTELRVRIAEQ